MKDGSTIGAPFSWKRIVKKGVSIGARLVATMLLGSAATFGYSVLTHEAIVDSVWETSIEKLLVKRFPNSTREDLDKAHAYTYGGCILQDMGYYPFGSRFFSDLTHYVRSGDFIVALLNNARDLNEYAFALGALAHYASDNSGHRLATNPAVPILYPKLAQKFGNTVRYWDDPTSHLRTEFGFDVIQVAGGKYASDQYHKFIGFEVSKPVLERAFQDTYGVEIMDIFSNLGLALSTYRYSVSSVIPGMTRIAWRIKKEQVIKANPGITPEKFFFNLSRSTYEKDWGKDYQKPSMRVRIVAWIIRVVPKIGPLKSLAFRPPTQEVEKLFLASLSETVDTYKALLADVDTGQLALPNRNFDVGDLTRLGTYQGADEAYAKLVDKLSDHELAEVTPTLRSNILTFYAGAAPPSHAKTRDAAKKEKSDLAKLMKQLMQLEAMQTTGANASH